MAPPSKLRPHLNDLLQKNLELEHVVADLRHQLTQSTAKWADERKLLAMGCDTLMASFAKFRARLDTHTSDWGDSEGEVERHLDAGGQCAEETGEVDHGGLETEVDQGSTVEESLRERCNVLAAELQVKEEELEQSRIKQEAAEEELQRVRRSLKAQSEQLREALASAKADTDSNKVPPEHIPDDASEQSNASKSELENAEKKLDLANREVDRLKLLLQQWQKYGNDWKREAQLVQIRASELELRRFELSEQIKAAEGRTALPETEQKEIERLTSALADQTAEVEQQREAYQDSMKRVNDLEAMVAFLRAQLSPEQLASIDSAPSQTTLGPTNSTQSPTPQADPNTNKRSDMIMLKIPYRVCIPRLTFGPDFDLIEASKSIKKPSNEIIGPGDERGSVSSSPQVPITISVPESPLPHAGNTPIFNPSDYEVCIHTCNPLPCRNEAQSFLWPRKQPSLPRHALSAKKHRHCTSECPGHRLTTMVATDALKQPRRAKCRPPTDAEIALAAEEISKLPANEQSGEQGAGTDGENGLEGSGESEGPEEAEGGSIREEEVDQGREEEQSPAKSKVKKRLRSRRVGAEEHQRAKKRWRRTIPAIVVKP